jgi:microcystin-dependent protein
MDNYIGTIKKFAINYPDLKFGDSIPELVKGWMPCYGQIMSIGDYPELYSVILSTYGGDDRNFFTIPDLRIRKADGNYYQNGEILPDETPYIQSYICIDGIFPQRD